VKELIIENLSLKNKLYNERDSNYRTKSNVKNDGTQQITRPSRLIKFEENSKAIKEKKRDEINPKED
jgi:hypothetical protein